MHKKGLRGIVGVLLVGLLLSMATVYSVAASELHDGGPTDPNQVRGVVFEHGPDFIIINMERYTLSKDVTFTNEEGGVLKNGRMHLRPDMQVDLTLKDNQVVSVTIYGLLMR